MSSMARSFSAPRHYEHIIVEEISEKNKSKVGMLRIKPNGILWKPAGRHKFLKVPLDTFIAWIESNGTPGDQ